MNTLSKIQNATQKLLALYPQSALVDIYKSFFQDAFGPGHLVDDLERARTYFDNELERMVSRGRHRVEPCGLGKSFYRIPMDLITDGMVEKEAYFEAFVKSARSFALVDLLRWKEEWQTIMEAVRPLSHLIREFEAGQRQIEALLARRLYASDHSDHYRTVYDPHYRIFTLEEMNALLGP